MYVVTWAFISWLAVPAFDAYGDMVENYAWGQTWTWGSFKHPPLFAWIVKVWFAVFPTQVWAYYLLSYLNAAAGVLGIVWLARLCLPEDTSAARRDAFLMAAALFAMLSFPYSNLAAKFNADTILLSVWPWTAYAFFAALHARDAWRRWSFSVLFGVLAAAAMLSKYYSALLLVSLAIVSLSNRGYRRWYRTPYPYVAVAVGALALLPHVLWESRVHFPFLGYLESKIDPHVDFGRVVLFLMSGIYYLPLSWLAWLLWRSRFSSRTRQPAASRVPLGALVLVCVLPAVITASFNLFARVHLTTHWAIPAWFALPVLMAVWLLPVIDDDFPWARLTSSLAIFWCVLIAAAIAYAVVLSGRGDPKYSLARQEMVKAIESRFAARFPSQELSWVGGSWPESGAVAFFGERHPRALPGLPDGSRAIVNPYPAWRERWGAILCYTADSYGREGSHNTPCEQETRDWLHARERAVDEETLTYRAEGWRYIRAQPKNITVFWIPPTRRP